MSKDNPIVFISYAHEGVDYEDKVLKFSNKLRSEGIDANIDLYEESPVEGWPRWMENQIKNSDYVLVVCNKSYYNKLYSEKKGKGVSWEVSIIYQYLYDAGTETQKFIPVFFKEDDEQYIPTPIKPFTFYNIGKQDGYEKLYWRLRGISKIKKPSLGKLKPLPEKKRKTMFLATPIDLQKWDNARWQGALYMFAEGKMPILGLVFENYEIAKEIFKEWKANAQNGKIDEFINLSYIVPPFPADCWIMKDSDHNRGKGYFIHIGPNIDKAIDRALFLGIKPEDLVLTFISRYQWMDEIHGPLNRDHFMSLTNGGKPYLLMPVAIKNKHADITQENLTYDFKCAVEMKNVSFYHGNDMKEDNMCKVVLNKPAIR